MKEEGAAVSGMERAPFQGIANASRIETDPPPHAAHAANLVDRINAKAERWAHTADAALSSPGELRAKLHEQRSARKTAMGGGGGC